MGFTHNIFIVGSVFLDLIWVSFVVKQGNWGWLTKKLVAAALKMRINDSLWGGLLIVTFAFSKGRLSLQIFLFLNVWVGAHASVLPVNNFGCVDVWLGSKDFSYFVSKDLRQELILMSTRSADSPIQVRMSVDEISKSHGLTTGVRNRSQLILNEVKHCAELGLSSFIENWWGRGMGYGLSCFS